MEMKVKCDKPYDLDAADKRRGKPRRRRKDSRTTAYELTIRFDENQRAVMGGKHKIVRVVYARNKKEDLARQIAAFEDNVNMMLRSAAVESGISVDGPANTVSAIVRRYLKAREPSVVPDYMKDSLELTRRYIDPTIGDVAFDELTVTQIAEALDSIPEISKRLNEEKRALEIAAREKRVDELKSRPANERFVYPKFRPIRVAGMPTMHKVLQLIKNAGNYAEDMGLIGKNVANNRRLSKQYPKNRAVIDSWTPDESRLIYSEIRKLPLSAKKVEFQLLFMCGMRPCEVLAVRFADLNLEGEQGFLHVVRKLKTGNAFRSIPLDPETTKLLVEWRESRKRFAEEIGVRFLDSWLVSCDDGQKAVYNTLKQRWMYFLRGIGLEHKRAYSMRHTFATNNAKGADPKTLSVLMGHASAGFTLSEYAGYFESAAEPVTTNYLEFLDSGGRSQKSEKRR